MWKISVNFQLIAGTLPCLKKWFEFCRVLSALFIVQILSTVQIPMGVHLLELHVCDSWGRVRIGAVSPENVHDLVS